MTGADVFEDFVVLGSAGAGGGGVEVGDEGGAVWRGGKRREGRRMVTLEKGIVGECEDDIHTRQHPSDSQVGVAAVDGLLEDAGSVFEHGPTGDEVGVLGDRTKVLA